jgi:hypothetical protein
VLAEYDALPGIGHGCGHNLIAAGAAAAAIAGCIAIGSGTTYCVREGVDPLGGLADVVAPARETKQAAPPKKRTVRTRRAADTTAPPAPVAIATPVPKPIAPVPQPTAQPTARPEPTPQPTPAPAPEEEYEPVAPAPPATAAAQAPPKASRTPAPAPASGPGEFDGP